MESQQPGTPFRSPHDLYLRQVMQHAIVVRELAQTFLPAEVLSLLNLDSLQLAAESFVSEALEEFFADVVYTCQMRQGGAARICLLIEHKSSHPGRHIYVQLGN